MYKLLKAILIIGILFLGIIIGSINTVGQREYFNVSKENFENLLNVYFEMLKSEIGLLKKEIADISVDIAGKVVGREVDKADHERFIDEFVSGINANNQSGEGKDDSRLRDEYCRGRLSRRNA